MPDVIELRVHGVGGKPPKDMLGETLPEDVVRVGGDGRSAFFARLKQRRVEGYAWGPLTSTGLMQPLWIFLLPFTLLNIAGWSLPPKSEGGRLWTVARWLIMFAGLALTLDYVAGTSMIVVRQLFFQWRLGGLIKSRSVALSLGALAMLILGLVVFLVARRKQTEFEGVRYERTEPSGTLRNKVTGTAEGEQGLAARGFWNSGGFSFSLLTLHALVASAGFVVLMIVAFGWGGVTWLGWRKYFVGLVLVNAAILTLLLLVCLGFRNRRKWFFTRHFRWVAPWSLAMASVGLATGMFGGAGLLIANTLPLPRYIANRLPIPSDTTIPNGLELDVTLPFGTAAVGAALVGAMIGANLLGRATREMKRILSSGYPPKNESPAGTEPNGVPADRLRALGRARAFSEFGRNADLLIAGPATVFALFAVPSVLRSIDLDQPLPVVPMVFVATSAITLGFFSARPVLSRKTSGLVLPVAILALPIIATISTRVMEINDRARDRVMDVTPDQIAQLGGTLAVLGFGTFLAFWVRGYFKPEQRRLIAIIWDVLTFFPRRFHPLAVRPYAERAVPELVNRIRDHVRKGRRVILSAHSQGAVLAFAALSQLKRLDAQAIEGNKQPLLKEVAFVTYGCPLTQLHARFCPAYFNSDLFEEMTEWLYPGKVIVEQKGSWLLDWTRVPASWRNFYRLTDYIGKEVYIGGRWEVWNQHIPDPPEEPLISQIPFEEPFEGPPDPFRAPWVGHSLHSHYNSEPVLKAWITRLSVKLGET